MSSCPVGTSSPTYFGGLVICLIVDLILGGIVFYLKRKETVKSGGTSRKASEKNDTRPSQVTPEKQESPIVSEKDSATPRPTVIQQITLPEVNIGGLLETPRGKSFFSSPSKRSPSLATAPRPVSEARIDLERGSTLTPATTDPESLTPTEPSKQGTTTSALLDGFNRSLGGGDISHLRMNFHFQNLGLRLKNGRSILAGVNGHIKSGSLTAIMGPSGAGKTTFMSVLMGKVARTDGKLYINGREGEMSKFKKIIGYVPQEDVMLREMTVKENILHAARVKLPSTWTSKEVETYADAVIEALGLSHVAHSRIGDETTRGVSGGQRKRVNIGIELAGVPLTLFLDEPTSGLDSTSALSVCDNLKDISRLGVTVVSVIHQPRYEIFRSFDWLVLLVPGGQTVRDCVDFINLIVKIDKRIGIHGADKRSTTVLSEHGIPAANAADLLMDILAGHGVNPKQTLSPADLVAAWERRPTDGHELEENQKGYEEFHQRVPTLIRERGAPWYKQIWYCHNRALIQHYRNLSSFILEIFVGCFAGAMIGIATGGNQMFSGVYVQPYTFLSPAPLSWFIPLLGLLIGMIVSLAGAPAGVKVFSEERTVYWREAASGHNVLSYYLGKTIAATYRFTFSSLHFTSMYVLLAKPQALFGRQFLVVFLLFYGVYGLAAIVSMVAARGNANLVAVIACLFAAIFCGFGPNLTQAKRWGIIFIWEISFNRWAAEAIFSDYLWPFWGVYDIQAVADSTGYTLGRFGHDMGIMVLLGAVWRVIAFLLMVFTNRDKQK
ncbi:hypothetical protein HK097_005473 [Rhizophlyctis rosea]|uniref:ABC transporter domain-containing protein n=1 Tax=Rhizophlyctis rosea TaxID=64517 RepID=A0AAD5X2G7_9FUNG|nr:hypothetical protein HK097_005473 [Rhizophlyctis rosea]